MIESEKALDKKLSAELKKIGGWSIKLITAHISGLPDRLCLLPGGRLFFAEIKTTGKKPRKIQLSIQNKLITMGFEVYVIDNSELIKKLIQRHE
jgi:hypothetical protein